METSPKKIGRRKFFNKGIKVAAVSAFVSSVFKNNMTTASEVYKPPELPDFIIDSHIHCGSTEKWVEDMVKTYRSYNAMACVLTWIEDLDLMVDAIKSYPDVFIGYGRVNIDDPKAVREIENFKKAGFIGMKFHSPQKNFDDISYFQVYRLCEEYRM
jgi:hypothetical protein